MGLGSRMGPDIWLRWPCPPEEPQDRAGQGPVHQPGKASQAPQPCTHPQTPWGLPRATGHHRIPGSPGGRERMGRACVTVLRLLLWVGCHSHSVTVPTKPLLEPLPSCREGEVLGSSEEAQAALG